MKKEYRKPATCVVSIQHQTIICTSPDNIPVNDDPEEAITNEELVW